MGYDALLICRKYHPDWEKVDTVVPPFSPHPPVVMVDYGSEKRVGKGKCAEDKYRYLCIFAVFKGNIKGHIKIWHCYDEPGIGIAELKTRDVPENVKRTHFFIKKKPYDQEDKTRGIISQDKRQHSSPEIPFEIIRVFPKADKQPVPRTEQKYPHHPVTDGDKYIKPVPYEALIQPVGTGLLPHVMEHDTDSRKSLHSLHLFQ